jgi:hypothetical protein
LKIFKRVRGVTQDKVLRGAKIVLNNRKSTLLSESKRSGKRRKEKGKETASGSESRCRLLVWLGV